jgi:hypothetical protein
MMREGTGEKNFAIVPPLPPTFSRSCRGILSTALSPTTLYPHGVTGPRSCSFSLGAEILGTYTLTLGSDPPTSKAVPFHLLLWRRAIGSKNPHPRLRPTLVSKAVPFFLGVEILGVSATLTLGSDPPTSKAVPIFSKLRTRQRAAVGCPVPANGQWAALQFLHKHSLVGIS